MILSNKSKAYDVKGLSNEEKILASSFLQGSVYCWCKNKNNKWFALRDLVGGDDYSWQGTPLYPLYLKHKISANVIKKAGVDAGHILKKVVFDDVRNFETDKSGMVRRYRWINP